MRIGLILLCLVGMSLADEVLDSVIDNPQLLYQMPLAESSPLAQKVTLNWKFNSFKEFTTTLQKTYLINSQIISEALPAKEPIALYVDNNSLATLITQACAKFGYSWTYQDNVVIFRALKPLVASKVQSASMVNQWDLTPKDHTLRAVLVKWCKLANWQLIWNVHSDYPITTTWSIAGSFESAVNEVLKASQDTDMPLMATMHDSNHVLEITTPAISK